jgi:hypothetical protein
MEINLFSLVVIHCITKIWICQVLTDRKGLSFWKRGAFNDFWWRRGRVELPVQKSPTRVSTSLAGCLLIFFQPPVSPSLGGEKEELGDTPILPRKDQQDPPKADCTSFEAPLAPPVLWGTEGVWAYAPTFLIGPFTKGGLDRAHSRAPYLTTKHENIFSYNSLRVST